MLSIRMAADAPATGPVSVINMMTLTALRTAQIRRDLSCTVRRRNNTFLLSLRQSPRPYCSTRAHAASRPFCRQFDTCDRARGFAGALAAAVAATGERPFRRKALCPRKVTDATLAAA